jgi:hypothetical protein
MQCPSWWQLLSGSTNFPPFMKPVILLSCLQEHFNNIFHLRLPIRRRLLVWGFYTKDLYAFPSSLHVLYMPQFLILLGFTIPITFCKQRPKNYEAPLTSVS